MKKTIVKYPRFDGEIIEEKSDNKPDLIIEEAITRLEKLIISSSVINGNIFIRNNFEGNANLSYTNNIYNEEEIENLKTEVKNLNQRVTKLEKENLDKVNQIPELKELFNAVLPSQSYNFPQLKTEIQKLKIQDLIPRLQTKQIQWKESIDCVKKKVETSLEKVLEFVLQTHQQSLEQSKENDPFFQGQLSAFGTILQEKLTDEELENLLVKQKTVLELEKQLSTLQEQQLVIQTKIEVFPKSGNC